MQKSYADQHIQTLKIKIDTNPDSERPLILQEHKTAIWPLPASDSVIATVPINTKVNSNSN